MGKGTFYGLSMKTPVIYAEIQVLLMCWLHSLSCPDDDERRVWVKGCPEWEIPIDHLVLKVNCG